MSGINDHQFSVFETSWRPLTTLHKKDGEIEEIPESAYCTIYGDGMIRAVLVDKHQFPQLFEAIILIGKAHFTGPRIQRYLSIYQAYECLVEERNVSFSAIRHALSHPPSTLSRRSTVEELDRIFGSRAIDFSIYRHLKEFYVHMGQLLISNDIALKFSLDSKLDSLRKSDLYPISFMDPA